MRKIRERERIMEENKEMILKEENNNMIMGIEEYEGRNKSNKKIFTTIKDPKIIYNLEGQCDYRLNDCEGEAIRVKDMLCKVIERKLENPIVNEETGEIKETEYKMITILIDELGKSYVTASKNFFYRFMDYCKLFPTAIEDGECEIRIIKTNVKNSSNKTLGFELI